MKDQEGDKLDEFFKKGLSTPPTSEIDEDWERMKAILIKKNRRSVFVPYRIAMLSAAALLLIAMGIFFYQNNEQATEKNKIAKEKPTQRLSDSTVTQFRSGQAARDELQNQMKVVKKVKTNAPLENNRVVLNSNSDKSDFKRENLTQKDTSQQKQESQIGSVLAENGSILKTDSVAAVIKPVQQTLAQAVNDLKDVDSLQKSTSKKTAESFKPYFSLGFNLSPDISGVNSVQNNKFGYSAAANIIFNATSRFSIQTGVAYGSKIYDTNFSNYKPNSSYVFPVQPYEVDANCEVLDIPLNLNYKMVQSNKFNVIVGAGLSSYIMLKEKYVFDYSNSTDRGPRRYSVANENQHYFAVANFSLSYDRKITGNTSLSFSPYLKLPLTNIGYGNVRLRSVGLSIGLITDFKKSTK